jgi:hypothetical protein
MNADELTALVRRRVESRYRRICRVHRELAKVDAAARRELGRRGEAGAAFGGSFEDFVFGQIDFSEYQKIGAEEFTLLFDEGLSDFDETFYQKAFNTNRENIRQTIFRSYIKIGAFYVCKKAGPLILSIMRSIHTSLEFAPLFVPSDLENGANGAAERDARYRSLAAALDNVVIRHDDGMETRLFAPEEGGAVLRGTFHPFGKAHTITLIPGQCTKQ